MPTFSAISFALCASCVRTLTISSLMGSLASERLDGVDERFAFRASILSICSPAKSRSSTATASFSLIASKNSLRVMVTSFYALVATLFEKFLCTFGSSCLPFSFVSLLYQIFLNLSRPFSDFFEKLFRNFFLSFSFSVFIITDFL